MNITSNEKCSAFLAKIMGQDAYKKMRASAAKEPKSVRNARWAEYKKKQDRGDLL